jgi:hypothetical protein
MVANPAPEGKHISNGGTNDKKAFDGFVITGRVYALRQAGVVGWTEAALLSVVDRLQAKGGACWAGDDYLAEQLNMTRGQVWRVRQRLEKKGLLTLDKRDGKRFLTFTPPASLLRRAATGNGESAALCDKPAAPRSESAALCDKPAAPRSISGKLLSPNSHDGDGVAEKLSRRQENTRERQERTTDQFPDDDQWLEAELNRIAHEELEAQFDVDEF